jgi:hypothetical protein
MIYFALRTLPDGALSEIHPPDRKYFTADGRSITQGLEVNVMVTSLPDLGLRGT